jgi:hypothetical protein
MPDLRLTGVNRVGADQLNLTFRVDAATIVYDATLPGGSAVVGRAVGLKAASGGLVELVADGQRVLGKLLQVEADGACSIAVTGVVTLPGGDAPPAVGLPIVGATLAAARGYIRAAASATAADLLAMRGTVFDPTTSTAIEVHLD